MLEIVQFWTGGMAQVVECLPNKFDALSSSSRQPKKIDLEIFLFLEKICCRK
jgi:hypothetical protein